MYDLDTLNFALLLLRCSLGVVMLAHGIRHIIGGGKIAGTGRMVREPRHEARHRARVAGLITEVGAGTMLVLGLLHRSRRRVWSGDVVAIITNHLKNGFFIFNKGEGYEYVMSLTVMALVAAALGPGQWSLDHKIDSRGCPRAATS